MVNGVKNTLIICLTILVSCVLFISYNEYTNRYTLVVTQDNSLYIFDKKSTILNKCSDKGCAVIETKLPSRVFFPIPSDYSPSKLFGSEKNMAEEIIKTEAVKKEEVQNNSGVNSESKEKEKKPSIAETTPAPPESVSKSAEPEKGKNETTKPEEEFVE
ncbi:MAG: hypothetical protein LBL32_01940 [Holosporales bacterium]|jgi:hypothetical protein|nr:hypothetical protein [Holosporales bacterium]